MTSYYLTEEASRKRVCTLAQRLGKEAINHAGGLSFPPESDYWKLNHAARQEIKSELVFSSFSYRGIIEERKGEGKGRIGNRTKFRNPI